LLYSIAVDACLHCWDSQGVSRRIRWNQNQFKFCNEDRDKQHQAAKIGAALERNNTSTSALEREITQAQDWSNQEQGRTMLYGVIRLNHLYKSDWMITIYENTNNTYVSMDKLRGRVLPQEGLLSLHLVD